LSPCKTGSRAAVSTFAGWSREGDLALGLLQRSDRHASEHEVHFVADCHPQTLPQVRWTNAQVNELAAQAVLGS
jgi:hypothetical protein